MAHRPLRDVWCDLANLIREIRHHPELQTTLLHAYWKAQLITGLEHASSALFRINSDNKHGRAA